MLEVVLECPDTGCGAQFPSEVAFSSILLWSLVLFDCLVIAGCGEHFSVNRFIGMPGGRKCI